MIVSSQGLDAPRVRNGTVRYKDIHTRRPPRHLEVRQRKLTPTTWRRLITVTAVARTLSTTRDASRNQCPYCFHRWRVGATVLAGGAGEIENVSQVFQPDGRFAASNSP